MPYFIITTDDISIVTLVQFISATNSQLPNIRYTDMYNKDYQEYKHLLDSEDTIIVEMAVTILSDKYKNQLINEI